MTARKPGPVIETRRPVELGDLCRLRWPIEPALRPDGAEVAYVVSGLDAETDRLSYRTFRRSIAGGPARRVVTARKGGNDRRPRWSPDGWLLAILTETPTGDQVDIVDAAGVATSARFPGAVEDFDWSPDGLRLVALHRSVAGAGQELTVVSADDASVVQSIGDPIAGEVTGIAWRPGTTQIAAVSTSAHGQAPAITSLLLVDTQTRLFDTLVEWSGPISATAWSPDGSTIAFLGHPDGPGLFNNTHLWTTRPDEADDPRNLTAKFDRSVGQAVRGDDERAIGPPGLAWSADGSRILAVVADRGRSGLVAFDLDGGRTTLADGDRAILDFAVSAASSDAANAADTGTDALVVSWSDPWQPGELSYLVDGGETVLTELNDAWLSEIALCETTLITARATDDAPLVDGWITLPDRTPDDVPVPLVVQVHGGPHYPIGFRFSFDAQRLAAEGMALLRCNPRGSHGYGGDFAAAIRGDWGGPDLADIIALTDRAATCPRIDAGRLGIVGESYGGYMVNWVIGHVDRFSAAIAENGISDVIPLARGPRGADFWCVEFDADPDADPAPFVARSPITHAASIGTPLLLLHAEDDDNCPPAQSEAMYGALADLGKPVEFVTVPNEGHMVNVFGRLSSRIARTSTFDEFLRIHLLGGQPPVSRNERATSKP